MYTKENPKENPMYTKENPPSYVLLKKTLTYTKENPHVY